MRKIYRREINRWGIGICMLMIIFFSVQLSMAIPDNNNGTSNITSNISSNVTNITYQVDVDQDYGFYRVIDRTTRKPINYTNKTLSINVGDTVTWVNDATPDESLTIISEQDLWENRSAYLRWNYQKFSYTFNKSGTYTLYVREYKRLQHQTIIVQGIEPTQTVIVNITTVPTKTYTPEPTINNTTPIIEKTKKGPISGIIAVIAILALYIYFKGRK